MTSHKTRVIEMLFFDRWDADSGRVANPLVTLTDVSRAIRAYNAERGDDALSDRNPANFFKDFVRNKRQANANWPKTVLEAGYTAKQATGAGNCFLFVAMTNEDGPAFPIFGARTERTPVHLVESVSLPLEARLLGRRDETWLTQVMVRLRILETHLTLFSPRRFVHVDHLQMSVKLANAEIDALFLGVEEAADGVLRETMIACEAKGVSDDFLEDQMLQQVRALFAVEDIHQNVVIPVGMKVVGPSAIHIVECEGIQREEVSALATLRIASNAVHELRPPVPGIG